MEEKQIQAILTLSKNKNISDAIIIEKKSDGNIEVDIHPEKVKRITNWSHIGSILSIVVFILSIFIIENPISVDLFGRFSILGLILIIFSNFLSNFTGNMWSVGRIGTNITRTSPEFLIKFIGWIILLIPIIYELI